MLHFNTFSPKLMSLYEFRVKKGTSVKIGITTLVFHKGFITVPKIPCVWTPMGKLLLGPKSRAFADKGWVCTESIFH